MLFLAKTELGFNAQEMEAILKAVTRRKGLTTVIVLLVIAAIAVSYTHLTLPTKA